MTSWQRILFTTNISVSEFELSTLCYIRTTCTLLLALCQLLLSVISITQTVRYQMLTQFPFWSFSQSPSMPTKPSPSKSVVDSSLTKCVVICRTKRLFDLIICFVLFSERVHFVDLELSAYNFEAFDIANLFCKYEGIVEYFLSYSPYLYIVNAVLNRWYRLINMINIMLFVVVYLMYVVV